MDLKNIKNIFLAQEIHNENHKNKETNNLLSFDSLLTKLEKDEQHSTSNNQEKISTLEYLKNNKTPNIFNALQLHKNNEETISIDNNSKKNIIDITLIKKDKLFLDDIDNLLKHSEQALKENDFVKLDIIKDKISETIEDNNKSNYKNEISKYNHKLKNEELDEDIINSFNKLIKNSKKELEILESNSFSNMKENLKNSLNIL